MLIHSRPELASKDLALLMLLLKFILYVLYIKIIVLSEIFYSDLLGKDKVEKINYPNIF